VPVPLGEGVRFFDARGVAEVLLERTFVSKPGQISDLKLCVLK
jgi:hypothetical protein